jgi:hypothetical protein
MTNSAKAINLRVRPLQSVDLSFPIDGLVGAQNDIHLLGKPVKAFDLSELYALLGTVTLPTVWVPNPPPPPGKINATLGKSVTLPATDQPLGWGRLKYDSQAIRDEMGENVLFELRSEHVKAALDKAVGQRENIWVQKYERSVYEATQKAFDRDDSNSKLKRLQRLATISQHQHDQLAAEYNVLRTTNDAGFNSVSSNKGVVRASYTISGTTSHALLTMPWQGGSKQNWVEDEPKPNNNQQNSAYTTGYEYRHPSLENDAQLERAQISLLEEQIATVSTTNYVFGSQIERDATEVVMQSSLSRRYLANDLNAIDLDIKRLQVAYIDTFLLSPIDGVVTGVFRNVGDYVRAAQAVLRVENDTEVYLVGTLKYRGLLHIGQSITINTHLFDSPKKKRISGKVAAVRGHDSEDELWDLLILCSNRDAGGLPLFPINYNFDFDDTAVDVS